VLDLVEEGACATKTILKDELQDLIAYMKDRLEIKYKKSKAMKNTQSSY
jgi:hypothetical protein